LGFVYYVWTEKQIKLKQEKKTGKYTCVYLYTSIRTEKVDETTQSIENAKCIWVIFGELFSINTDGHFASDISEIENSIAYANDKYFLPFRSLLKMGIS